MKYIKPQILSERNIEIWKDIKGYEGLYQVSNWGRVKSLRNNIILKPALLNHKGRYPAVGLHKKGKTINPRIHRLVAEYFIDNPENKKCVNHKNGWKWCNCVNNLEWATHRENTRHAYEIGLMGVGENSPSGSKLKNNEVLVIKALLKHTNLKQYEIAEIFNVDPSAISNINRGKDWKQIGEELKKPYKLNLKSALVAKTMIGSGLKQHEIAELFGVSDTTITSLKQGKHRFSKKIANYFQE